MDTRRRVLQILAQVLVLSAALFPLAAHPQKAPKRLSKGNVTRLLKGDVSPRRVEEMARERGIDFELTTAIESELRQAGATDELLATLRKLAPKLLKPDPAEAHYNLGLALWNKGDLDGEIGEFREAIRLKPDFADPHFLLGWALEAKGDRQAGLEEYRKAYELDPKDSGIRGRYEKLLKELNK